MSNIAVTHAPTGLVRTRVVRSERVTPNMVRVTFAGEDLDGFVFKGFDQWFRLAIPVHADDRFDNLPSKFGIPGLLKFLTLPKGTRPAIRNYTVRQFREDPVEMDVDFVAHETRGVAGPWACTVEPGAQVAFIDQGCGWKALPAERNLIIADESAMPAALGILRDMPRGAEGDAIIEVFDEADKQEHEAPAGMNVHWVVREPDAAPGTAAMPALRELAVSSDVYAFSAGEAALATGARRHLVNERGVPKSNVTFCGYWRVGKSAPG